MVCGRFSTFTVLVVLIAISFQQASALHCWHCNSKDQTYCGDPFETDHLTKDQRAGNYAECPSSGIGTPAVCVKMISNKNGVERIGRVCSTSFLAAEVLCKENGAEGLCEKCETDGCNGATQYGPIAILIVLPIAIVKFLSS